MLWLGIERNCMGGETVFPKTFAYYASESVDDVLDHLNEYGYDAKILAGGQSLLPLMKLRLAAPGVLIDVNRVSELTGVRRTEEGLVCGALTRHAEMESGAWPEHPLLAQAAGQIADPIVRNRGTMAGSLAHADPAADWGAVLLALNAQVHMRDKQRTRSVAVSDFFQDTFTTALEPTELITHVAIPAPPANSWVGGEYLKMERKVGDFAVVGAAVTASLDHEGRVMSAGIGLAAVGSTPLKATRAEELLKGRQLSPELVREVAQLAAEQSRPFGDRRGSEEYKRAMVRVFVERGLTAIIRRWSQTVDHSA